MGHLLELAKLQIEEAHRETDRRAQATAVRRSRTQPTPQPSLLRRLTRTTVKAA